MVCDKDKNDSDELVFNLGITYEHYKARRSEYSKHFDMKKEHWDGGWGWIRQDPDWPFSKMLASCYLLEWGVWPLPEGVASQWEDRIDLVNFSFSSGLSFREPVSAVQVPENLGLEDFEDTYFVFSHAFVTDSEGNLHHCYERIGDGDSEWVKENLTSIANSTGESRIAAIVALIDTPSSLTELDTSLCTSTYRPAVSGSINEDAHLWVFGRDPDGEIVIYTLEVYDPNAVWQSFNLSNVLSIQDPSTTIGSDEPPIIVISGTGLEAEVDIISRVGHKLYHYKREPNSTSLASGWSGELIQTGLTSTANVPLTIDLQVHSKPVAVVKKKNIHIFFRNENGALMELIYVKFGRYRYGLQSGLINMAMAGMRLLLDAMYLGLSRIESLPALSNILPWPYWRIINVDNDIAGVNINDTIPYDSAGSEIAAISAKDGRIHVFQVKADEPYGLSRYCLDCYDWKKNLWSSSTTLSSDPFILENSISVPAWNPSQFFVFVVNGQQELLQYQYHSLISSFSDNWYCHNLTQEAVRIDDHSDTPMYSIWNEVAPSLIVFRDWVIVNVFSRLSNRVSGVRYKWGLADYGSRPVVELNPPSMSIPAISEFEQLTEIFTVRAQRSFTLYRLIRDFPWHSNSDYYNWASGKDYGFEYKPDDDDDHTAWASYSPYWNVDMKCPSFESDYGTARRAAVMLHEATHLNKHFRHGRYNSYGYDHQQIDGDDMDPWLDHPLGDIPHGSLDPEVYNHKHSMNQIQIEFLADIGEFPGPNLPSEVWNSAVSHAESRMRDRIIGITPWTPGEPRPFR